MQRYLPNINRFSGSILTEHFAKKLGVWNTQKKILSMPRQMVGGSGPSSGTVILYLQWLVVSSRMGDTEICVSTVVLTSSDGTDDE